MLAPCIDLTNDDADLTLIAKVMQIFDVGHGRRFKRRLLKGSGVVGLDMPGVDSKRAG
jgi:hypothetical protein